MWHSLRLQSLGVISEAEVEFGSGFTVITGETGAGKTMVISALALLRGERANTSLIRKGSSQARIEATVNLDDVDLAELVREAGGEVDDELILARVLSPQGRSRAIAGGASVPAGLLAKVTDRLVAVHGQSDQQRLVHVDQQRIALDRFAGPELAATMETYSTQWRELQEAKRQLDALNSNSAERLQRLEFLRFGLAEVADLAPVRGEDLELQTEENRLAHAESLVTAAMGAAHLLADADITATSLLNDAMAHLHAAEGHDETLDLLAARLKELSIDLEDIASELHSYGTAIDIDPQRLGGVQERRAALGMLQRKYGPTLDEVIDWAESAAREIADLDLGEEGLAQRQEDVKNQTAAVEATAARISQLRRAAAGRLATAIEAELADLALDKATMNIEIEASEIGPHGADRIRFLFAANSGSEAQPIGQSASGGELSRLMLAIEVVLADRDPVPTLVFDEVDAGIGGRTAVEVGRKLARLAKNAQIIVVTHLAQVAAFADQHFVVSKNDDGDVTHSSVFQVDGAQRVEELARMLSGLEDSETALAHARELLETSLVV